MRETRTKSQDQKAKPALSIGEARSGMLKWELRFKKLVESLFGASHHSNPRLPLKTQYRLLPPRRTDSERLQKGLTRDKKAHFNLQPNIGHLKSVI